jgi:hypothetical protein
MEHVSLSSTKWWCPMGMFKNENEPVSNVNKASRRQFIRSAVAGVAVAAVGSAVVSACGGDSSSDVVLPLDSHEVDDGSHWKNKQWLEIPAHIRQMLFQASEVFRATESGAILPVERVISSPLAFVLRDDADSPVKAAYLIRATTYIENSKKISSPPTWNLGVVQLIDNGPILAEIAASWDGNPPFSPVTINAIEYWGVVIRDRTSYGLQGDNWRGSQVWFHEYIHGIQPAGPEVPTGWHPWDATWKFPSENTALIALSFLEQRVLEGPSTRTEALHALKTFLVIRERKRNLHDDYVTTSEHRETSEGFANYVEGRFLNYTKHTGTRENGTPLIQPPPIPTDTQRWKNYFGGEIVYAGSSIYFALDIYDESWKSYYLAQKPDAPGISLTKLVQHYIRQPDEPEAQQLFEQAATRHNLRDIERRIDEANIPQQKFNPDE